MTDPTPLVAAATGFMAAKQLFAASELGVFAALPGTAAEVAERAGLPERSARILADAMVGMGLVTHADGVYANTEVTSAYLAGGDGLDLRPWLAFWNSLSYPHWQHYTESMRTAKPGPFQLDEATMGEFMAGVQTYNSLHARMLAENYDFTAHRNVLDLGGLSTAFLAEAAARAPELRGAFVSTADFLAMVSGSLPADVADRISFHEADPLTDDVPGRYDAVLLEHVIHRFDAEQNKTFLRVARGVVDPGATLLVLDFLLDPADGRRIDPVLAGEYLVIDGTVVYPEAEVVGWLAETGWRLVEVRPLPGSPRVVVAEAV
ncbi:acetylserotonin O-methyltransferase [Actinokineospora sp. UTMC 2448]|uniref:acetylserotonin O-methyltransferase n=1 Tax=Actinokineospora sp. UTMC 2448 TaxID=2268449 RepID=UPI0021646A83|nr:acetylserotonin O-methyltransferase [Actinokineospora sp. UTMC 2448]UVS80040.1 Multifunctional cyclase-dehydratase-3-O-methyl transferase TcmN [Actinokineospora sp. UTMC 2448]